MMVPMLSRSRCQRPRSAMSPGMASTRAAIVTRARTAEPAVQPIPMRPFASDPDRPNDAAATIARGMPVTKRGVKVVFTVSLVIVAMTHYVSGNMVMCQNDVRS